jgi:hypothetical protein
VCLVCAICNGIINGGSKATASSQKTSAPSGPTATHGPSATPTPNYAHFGDGQFEVGKDIQPGTYRARVTSSSCYWERLRGFDGTFDEIIANGNEYDPTVVTIPANDKRVLWLAASCRVSTCAVRRMMA